MSKSRKSKQKREKKRKYKMRKPINRYEIIKKYQEHLDFIQAIEGSER